MGKQCKDPLQQSGSGSCCASFRMAEIGARKESVWQFGGLIYPARSRRDQSAEPKSDLANNQKRGRFAVTEHLYEVASKKAVGGEKVVLPIVRVGAGLQEPTG